MTSLDELYERYGGPAQVAKVIGVSTEHAAGMKRRKSIPVDYWAPLVADAATRGWLDLTYEALVRMHAKKPSAPPLIPAEGRVTTDRERAGS